MQHIPHSATNCAANSFSVAAVKVTRNNELPLGRPLETPPLHRRFERASIVRELQYGSDVDVKLSYLGNKRTISCLFFFRLFYFIYFIYSSASPFFLIHSNLKPPVSRLKPRDSFIRGKVYPSSSSNIGALWGVRWWRSQNV
jgi:hypothetical protein